MIRLPVFLSFFILAFCFNAQGASYIYSSLDSQLRDSDAVVSGVITGSQFVRSADGEVFTKYSLRLKKVSGINENNIYASDSFSFVVPGGDWQGIRYQISGAPLFEEGEETLLLLKKKSGEFTPLNLGMGKYSYKRIDGAEYLQSSVFPNHPELGKISLKEIEKKIDLRFGTIASQQALLKKSSFSKDQNFISSASPQTTRGPASTEESQSSSKMSMLWLVALLGGLVTLKFAFKIGR